MLSGETFEYSASGILDSDWSMSAFQGQSDGYCVNRITNVSHEHSLVTRYNHGPRGLSVRYPLLNYVTNKPSSERQHICAVRTVWGCREPQDGSNWLLHGPSLLRLGLAPKHNLTNLNVNYWIMGWIVLWSIFRRCRSTSKRWDLFLKTVYFTDTSVMGNI